MDQESIVLEVDPRSVLAAIKQANTAVDGWEQNTVGAGDKMQKSLERMAEMLLKVNDKSRNSMERLTQSIEKQAAAYGKTGIEKLVAERDRLIKKLGDEQGMVDRVTASYAKMIAAESGQNGGSFQALGRNIQTFVQSPVEASTGALSGLMAKLGPVGMGAAAFAAVLGSIETAGLGATHSLADYGVQVRDVELRTGLAAKEVGQFGFAAKAVGQDVSVFERTMRGLTEAVADNSEAGDKARKAMEKLGVAPRDAAGEIRPTADLLNDLSKALNDIPNAIDRNKAGMDIFKRAWVEIAPAVLDLSQNLERAKALGLGPNEADVDRWLKYKEQLTEADALWDRVGRKIKEGIAGSIWIDVKATGAKWILDFLGGDAGKPPQTFIEGSHSTTHKQNVDYLLNAVTSMGDEGSVTGLKTFLKSGGGLEQAQSELSKLKKSYDDARNSAEQLTQSKTLNSDVAEKAKRDVIAARTAYENQQKVVESFRPKSPTEAERLAAKGDTVYVLGSGLSQQVIGVNPADSIEPFPKVKAPPSMFGPGQNGAMSAITGEPVYKEGMQHIFTPGTGLESVFVSPDASRTKGPTYLGNGEGTSAEIQAARWKAEGDFQKQQEQIALSGIQAESTATVRLLELRGKDEADTARQIAGVRQDALDREYALTRDLVKLRTGEKQNEIDLQLKLAEIEDRQDKQHEQQIRQAVEPLAHTLLTKPGQFGKQLGGSMKELALRPIEDMMTDAVTSILKPALFGSKQDPLKVSTDINNQVTVLNTDAMRELTATLATGPRFSSGGRYSGGSISYSGGDGASAMPWGGSSIGFGGGGGSSWAGGSSFPTMGGDGLPMSDIRTIAPELGGWNGGGFGRSAGGAGLAGGFAGLFKSLGTGSHGLNFKSMLSGMKGTNWGGFTRSDASGAPQFDDQGNYLGDTVGQKGSITGVSGVAGQLMSAGGMTLAEHGLLGSARGTWGGVAEGAAGGAAVGFQQGGPLGAAIGGGIGLLAGIGEKLAGVETPVNEAKRLVKQQYGISIDTAMANQIVSLAQQKYASHVSIAVRDPEVRKMLMLYAQGTGQKFPMSATTPEAGSLAEVNGRLYQQATYNSTNGAPSTFQSNLPVLGNLGGSNYASPSTPNVSSGMGPISLSMNISGADTMSFLTGQVVTPQYVSDQSIAAQNASMNRTQQSANTILPGLTVG